MLQKTAIVVTGASWTPHSWPTTDVIGGLVTACLSIAMTTKEDGRKFIRADITKGRQENTMHPFAFIPAKGGGIKN